MDKPEKKKVVKKVAKKPTIKKPKKNEQTELPEIKITDIEFDTNVKPKKKDTQLRRSNFFITINTNQRFNKHSEEYHKFNTEFKNCIDKLFNKDNIHNVIQLKNKDAEFTNKSIKSVNIDKVVELGPVSGCVHLHAIISTEQYTPLQLNFSFIVDFVKQQMKLSNVYLNSKIIKDGITSVKDYIKKGEKQTKN